MTVSEKKAIETAYEYFKNPNEYPLIHNNNTPEKNAIIVETLDSLFNFDECGYTTGLDRNMVEKFLNIKKFKGIE